jgi:HemY protein
VLLAFGILVAVVLGGVVGTLIVRDAGYVLIAYGDTVIETSIWVGLAALGLFYFLLRGISYVVSRTAKSQSQVMRWRSGRKTNAARRMTIRGMLFMAEGRWEEARKALVNAAEGVDMPLINYLQAARGAHELGESEERDRLLKLAHESTPGAKFAATLTQAEFQMSDGRYEQALAALLNLRKRAPKHTTVLAMLAACYEALGDWQALHEILAEVVERDAVSEVEVRRLSRLVWQFLLQEATSASAAWKKLPKSLKNDDALVQGWVAHLIEAGRDDDAEEVIGLALDQSWSLELIRQYGMLQGSEPARQLITAKKWAKSRPNDPELLVCLGRLSLRCESFPEAREYFDAALRLSPEPEVYAELGRLCIALGDERRGKDYLLRSVQTLPDLPLPGSPSIRA